MYLVRMKQIWYLSSRLQNNLLKLQWFNQQTNSLTHHLLCLIPSQTSKYFSRNSRCSTFPYFRVCNSAMQWKTVTPFAFILPDVMRVRFRGIYYWHEEINININCLFIYWTMKNEQSVPSDVRGWTGWDHGEFCCSIRHCAVISPGARTPLHANPASTPRTHRSETRT